MLMRDGRIFKQVEDEISTRPTPVEWTEAFLAGIKKQKTSGDFLVTFRGGRPTRIREVTEDLQPK